MPEDNAIYAEETFDSPMEFLNQLRPSNPTWLGPHALGCYWVFRGQGNAEWDLLPSAWRPDGRAKLQPCLDRIRLDIERETDDARMREYLIQIIGEICAVDQFATWADRLGLRIPELDKLESGKGITDHLADAHARRLSRPSMAVAVAQHHGIPTRLLDFTYQGPIAAFFAAESADRLRRSGENVENLAVWAVNWQRLEALSAIERLHYPRIESAYMHAQDGLFLFHSNAHVAYFYRGDWPSFREVMQVTSMGGPTLRKLIISIDYVQELLRLLWAEGIYRARLMPTFDNAALAVFESWRYREGTE